LWASGTAGRGCLGGLPQSQRAHLHEARGADAVITDAIDARVESEQGNGDDDGGASGAVAPAG